MALRVLATALLLPIALAQVLTASSPSMPTASDSAPGGNDDSGDDGTSGTSLVNYYFVFLALIICVAGLCGFLLWRRKKRYGSLLHTSRQQALAQDVRAWHGGDGAAGVGGHWSRRGMGSEDVGREEGLNELGEAPPAYAPAPRPKTREEEAEDVAMGERRADGGHDDGHGPAVPLQTLSRDQAGLKPPEYAEATVRSTEDDVARDSGSGEGSSRAAEQTPLAREQH